MTPQAQAPPCASHSPGDHRVISDFSQTRHLDEGGNHRFLSQSVEERLNLLNKTWGYTRSESVIVGSFQSEMNEITAKFEAMGSKTDYMATARLYVGAEFEFPGMWGLFAVGRSPDFDQYKRTVYVVETRLVLGASQHHHEISRERDCLYCL